MVHIRSLSTSLATALATISAATASSDYRPQHHKSITSCSARDIIKQLSLVPNVERGYYIQTFRDSFVVLENHSASTAIYYLLEGEDGDPRWHRVADVEIWHYYAGAHRLYCLCRGMTVRS